MYLKVAKKAGLKGSHHKQKCNYVCMMTDVTRFIVLIISQGIQMSNHYVIYLKLT